MVLGGDEPTGSLVRPYAVTRGRTRPQLEIALEALVETTARGRSGQFLGGREQKVIVDLCGGRLQSLAEIAARMEVPLGVARVLAFPEIVEFRLPHCVNASGPCDPMFLDVDPARNCRQVYVNFLQHWRRMDFGGCVDRLLAR